MKIILLVMRVVCQLAKIIQEDFIVMCREASFSRGACGKGGLGSDNTEAETRVCSQATYVRFILNSRSPRLFLSNAKGGSGSLHFHEGIGMFPAQLLMYHFPKI